jgi:hypothetical protein
VLPHGRRRGWESQRTSSSHVCGCN